MGFDVSAVLPTSARRVTRHNSRPSLQRRSVTSGTEFTGYYEEVAIAEVKTREILDGDENMWPL